MFSGSFEKSTPRPSDLNSIKSGFSVEVGFCFFCAKAFCLFVCLLNRKVKVNVSVGTSKQLKRQTNKQVRGCLHGTITTFTLVRVHAGCLACSTYALVKLKLARISYHELRFSFGTEPNSGVMAVPFKLLFCVSIISLQDS